MDAERPLARRARPRLAGVAAATVTIVALAVALPFAQRKLVHRAAPAVPAPAGSAPAAPTLGPPTERVGPLPSVAEVPAALQTSVLTVRLGRNQTLGQLLSRLSLGPGQAQAILRALQDKFPFHRARPGDQIRIERLADASQALKKFTYRQSPVDEWIVAPADDGTLRGEKRQVELRTETARVDVEIRGSVWETLQRAGEDAALAVIASDVLAWDVDFYQDVRAGDRLKLLVEKVYADGAWVRYGDVLGAEYDGRATGRKRLFRYTDPSGRTSYYDDAGNSARRGFLRSPLKYAAVSSRFGNRVHPILGYVKAHEGVDYRAPTGTPVWAVGDGNVVQAGSNGACGKSVTLHHRNGLDTLYCHLSAVTVRPGARVSQKQVIGRVGQTGRATGPHLHYAIKRNGGFMNPGHLKVPPEAPVAPAHRHDFEEKVAPLRAALEIPVA